MGQTHPADVPPQGGWRARRRRAHRWFRVALAFWAVGSTTYLINSMRTQGVEPALLRSSTEVAVIDAPGLLEFAPATPTDAAALVFFCGAGVGAHAYAPLLRPVAAAGYRVFVIKLPYRLAPLPSHADEALARARRVVGSHPTVKHWVFAGHSFGGVLAARLARDQPSLVAALVLIGTTHPKEDDLSSLTMPVTKVYGTVDGVAPAERVLENRRLLPPSTRWVAIEGGNHSQFGHYGHQLFDGTATITREAQQAQTRAELLASLAAVAN